MRRLPLPVMLATFACYFFIPCAPLRAQLVDGLLNYWSFEGNYTDTAQGLTGAASTVADNGIPLDEFTVALTPGGQLGSYANFIGGYVEVPDSDDIQAAGESLTISAWFRVTAFDQSWQALISHGEGGDYRIARRDASNVMAYAGGTGDIPGSNIGPDVNDGQWHHVVAISEAGVSARLWVDGGLVATGGAPTISDNGQGRLMIGGNPGTGAPYRPWNGDIDDIGMWNKPLSDPQIQQIYTEGLAGRSLLTLLGPPVVPVYKTARRNGNVIEATFEDSPTGFVDITKARSMTVDGVLVTPTTIAKVGSITTVSYTITAVYPPGSDHTVTTTVTSSSDTVVTGTSTIRAPFASVIDGPGRWRTEMVYTRGSLQINTAAEAEFALDDVDNFYPPEDKITVRTDYIHFHDNADPPLFLDLSKPFPLFDPDNGGPEGTGFGDRDDFAIRSTEQIKTTIAGKYWFNCNSDDGFSLWVDGELIGSAGNRGRTDTPMSKVLTAGLHEVKLVYWERGGGAGLSLYVYKGISETQPPFTVDSAELLKAFGDNTDTDGDGMPDSFEVAYGLNPNVNDAALDKDGDTLSNLAEYLAGTRPDLKDTDADGLDDNVETGTGTYVSPANTGTNPKVADTDTDGLRDGVETNTGVYVSASNTGSNPLIADTDGDGMSDGSEVGVGRNPVNAGDAPPGLGRGLVAYWNFDNSLDDVAHTLATDSTVADTGAFTGPATDVGYGPDAKFGPSSLQQNGGAGWVTVKSSADTLHGTTNTVSISVWAKATALDTGWQGIVSHGEGNQYRIARNGESSDFAYAGGTGDITGGNPGDDGLWHHIAAISDPDFGTSLYVDGILVANGGIPDINDLGNGGTIPDLFIGNNPQGPGREWNGNLDDVAIWGRVLTEAEVTSIWADGAGKSIASLLGGGGGGGGASFAISSWSYNAGTGQFTLEWPSTPGQNFGIHYSTNMANWPASVALSIPAAGAGATRTSFSFPNPQPGVPRLFFRVTRN